MKKAIREIKNFLKTTTVKYVVVDKCNNIVSASNVKPDERTYQLNCVYERRSNESLYQS